MSKLIKVTKTMREELLTELERRAFTEQHIELLKQEEDLGDQIYMRAYDADTRGKMASLPKSFFPRKKTISALLGDDYYRMAMSTERPFPFSHEYIGVASVTLDANDPLVQAYEGWKTTWDAFRELKYRHLQAVKAFLDSCPSIKQVRSNWPELTPLIDKLMPDKKDKAVPAVIQNWNEIFKLPPDEVDVEDCDE